jgi:FkbM family methyltransferase
MILSQYNKASDVTLVTGLWDTGRGNLSGIWARPYEFYLEKFKDVLELDCNLIVFGDNNLKEFVSKYRSSHNTEFVDCDLEWFKFQQSFASIDKIRSSKEWQTQSQWITESPMAKLEFYMPIVISKMFLLKKAINLNKFNSNFYYWIDAGITNTVALELLSTDILESIPQLTEKNLFIGFPYRSNWSEVQGLSHKDFENLTGDKFDILLRGTFFGGHKKSLTQLIELYANLLDNLLAKDILGTEEILFSILMHQYPNMIEYFEVPPEVDGRIYTFFQSVKSKSVTLKNRVKHNMDDLFVNFSQIKEYFNPRTYLDIGANKGENIEFICSQLPSIEHVEMIEGARHCKWNLEQINSRTGYPFHLEVLSDSIKSVLFYLDTDPDRITGPGNSYYPENSNCFHKFPFEERITNTLDNLYINKSFDLIKLDTQGSELDILKGGTNLISKAKGIIVEENPVPLNTGSPSPSEIKLFLEGQGFKFIKHLKWWGGWVPDKDGQSYWYEQADSLYIRKDVLENLPPLPISVGILAWQSDQSLRNTLESYRQNGLFKAVDDVVILFQEARDEDKKLAKEYGLPYIALDTNVGIGRGFVMLCEQADHPHILLLEDDWELTSDYKTTRETLKASLDMLNADTDVVRLRSRRNPGYPLYSREAYEGREMDHYDPTIDATAPHLFEAIHWVENPEMKFPGLIYTENGHYVTNSRWSNWTNNPCLHRRDFYIELVSWFGSKGLLLEPEISHWWTRQQFKVAWGEGLFTHNDIDKHGKNSDEVSNGLNN